MIALFVDWNSSQRFVSDTALRRTMEAHGVVRDVIDSVPLHVAQVNYGTGVSMKVSLAYFCRMENLLINIFFFFVCFASSSLVTN